MRTVLLARAGGFSNDEAAMHFGMELWRAIVAQPRHQHRPCLIGEILCRLANRGEKRPECRKPFRIVESEQRNICRGA